MNPRLGLVFASFLVASVIVAVVWLLSPEAPWFHLLSIFVSSWLCTGLAIYLFARRYLSRRLLPIYRTLLGKNSADLKGAIDSLDNPMDQAEMDVTDWADQRIQEIKDLQAKDDFRKEFIGNLAHELKTPLFNIQGYVNSLIEGAMEDEKVRERFLEKANRNIERMTRIVEDLDTISHLEYGRMEMEMANMDIVKCARDVIEGLEEMAASRSVELVLTQSEPLMVVGDEFRIGQVLVNLISNAIAYGKAGGRAEVSFSRMADHVLVEVSDNGLGINSDEMPRIFERFYRVDKSRSRNIAGSGLGLSIVKHIIESHGQTIHANSVPNEGSSFSFTLNRAKGG